MTFTHAGDFSTRPTLQGHFGMTASTHWLATGAAQAVLERGGNAFDAAVAGGFVLHVVEPHLNGPGGDMTGLFVTAEDPSAPKVLMGQGPAPADATLEHYRNLGLDRVPGAGGLAAAVPAAVDAWLLLLRDHGTWGVADVLAFAIDYAENGYPAVPRIPATIRTVAQLFTEHWPTSADQWMPGGEIPEDYATLTNRDYAQVLRELIAAGAENDSRYEQVEAARREWRTGRVATSAAEFLKTPHRHSDGGDYPGVITREDFAEACASYEEPATVEFRPGDIAGVAKVLPPLHEPDPHAGSSGFGGGDQQDQWQLLFLLRYLVGGHSPQQAIDAPVLHTSSMPASFWPRNWQPGAAVVEDRLGEDVIAGLQRRGHRITRAGDWSLGRISCVTRDTQNGRLTAAANPRGAQGYAAGR